MVRAYLEIEELRLGAKLQAEIEVDPDVLGVEVPVLSIQPLVENAVKHGAAARPGGGFVRLAIHREGDSVVVDVSNSGTFAVKRPLDSEGTGMGLENVRRRLALCYGAGATLDVDSRDDLTTVRFRLPVAAGVQR